MKNLELLKKRQINSFAGALSRVVWKPIMLWSCLAKFWPNVPDKRAEILPHQPGHCVLESLHPPCLLKGPENFTWPGTTPYPKDSLWNKLWQGFHMPFKVTLEQTIVSGFLVFPGSRGRTVNSVFQADEIPSSLKVQKEIFQGDKPPHSAAAEGWHFTYNKWLSKESNPMD